jgi:2-haloacid dehalogenase
MECLVGDVVQASMKRRIVVLGALLFLAATRASAQGPAHPRFKAVAFDYFVIFNPDSIIPTVEREFPGKSQELAKLWRSKLFDYGFLRSITHDHRDFFKVTEDSRSSEKPA